MCICKDGLKEKCQDYQIFNSDTCKCECPAITCLQNQVSYPYTCQCVCTDDSKAKCQNYQIINSDTCECECPTITCRHNQLLDPYFCKCVCPQPKKCASALQVFSNDICKCEYKKSDSCYTQISKTSMWSAWWLL